MLGPLLLTRLVSDPRRPAFVFGPFAVRGAVDVVLAAGTALPVASAPPAVRSRSTRSCRHTPADLRGRISARFDVLRQPGRLVSLLVGGLLAATLGIQAVYHFGGAQLLLAARIGWSATAGPAAA